MTKNVRVLIAEDHTILREGLRALLRSDPEIEVVGEVENGRDAIRLAGTLAPSLILMDLSMPGINGIEAIAEIKKRFSAAKVIALTVHKTDEYIREALQVGVDGYVLKDATAGELIMAIKSVANGKTYLSPSISERIVSGYLGGSKGSTISTAWDTLTHREREILKLIAEGHTNKHIAGYLSVSVKTVEKHRSNLMKKLDLHNAPMLTAFAIEKGMIG